VGPWGKQEVRSWLAILSVAIWLLAAVPSTAQQPGGALTGLIIDPSGARIANATVTLVSTTTDSRNVVKTGSEGSYSFSSLVPGSYRLRVEASGFRTSIIDLEVEVGRVRQIDIALQIGPVVETMTVKANPTDVNPAQTALEGIVTQKYIQSLPLNGRNFLDLGQLEPGVQLNSGGAGLSPKAPYSTLSTNGLSGLTTRATLDGIDITDESFGTVMLNVSQDTLREYQISRSVFDASTGLTGSGAVNVATKTGSNDFHGSGFFFWRDSAWAARVGQDGAPFSRQQGGFELGGPLARDRLFFFIGYELNHQNNVVATNLPAFPQFDHTWPLPFDERMATARLDAQISSTIRAFSRFTYDWNSGIVNGTLGGGNLSPQENRDQANQSALGVDVLRGRLTHSFRFGYTHFGNIYQANQSAVPGLPQSLDPAGRPLTVAVTGAAFAGATIGPYPNSPGRRFQESYELRYDENLSVVRHTMHWGMDYNRIRINWFESILGAGPQISLTSSAATQAVCGSEVLCYPVSVANISNGLGFWTETPCLGLPHGCVPNDRFHWYASDAWRVTPRLNVNLGLRWVYEPGPDNPDLVKPAILNEFMPREQEPPRQE
jgi:hypothetical protein